MQFTGCLPKIQEKKMKPVKIKIYNTVSVVHYTYLIKVKGKDGREIKLTELRTDVLIKKEKQWKLVASSSERQPPKTTKK